MVNARVRGRLTPREESRHSNQLEASRPLAWLIAGGLLKVTQVLPSGDLAFQRVGVPEPPLLSPPPNDTSQPTSRRERASRTCRARCPYPLGFRRQLREPLLGVVVLKWSAAERNGQPQMSSGLSVLRVTGLVEGPDKGLSSTRRPPA